jgi:hypothetical protein
VVLSPSRFAAVIREQGISTIFLTTALFKLMASLEPAGFGGVTNVLFGGQKSAPDGASATPAACLRAD